MFDLIFDPYFKVAQSGLFLEFGAYKGESINYYSNLAPYLHLYGLDSFQGLPDDWSGNFLPDGYFDSKGTFSESQHQYYAYKIV